MRVGPFARRTTVRTHDEQRGRTCGTQGREGTGEQTAEDVQLDNLEERSQAESSSSPFPNKLSFRSASFLIAMAGCILSFERGL